MVTRRAGGGVPLLLAVNEMKGQLLLLGVSLSRSEGLS